jgi:hypothetical protein
MLFEISRTAASNLKIRDSQVLNSSSWHYDMIWIGFQEDYNIETNKYEISTYLLTDELKDPAVSDAFAEAKQCSQMVIAWVTTIYYLKLLRASEGTLSRWFQLHLQSLAPTYPH